MAKVELENQISLLPSGNFKREIVRSAYGPKIRDIRPEKDETIKNALRYIFTLVGLKADNIPDDTQKLVLLNFVRNDLGHYGLEELSIAFHMLLKGELGLSEADAEHYQNFSAKYLSTVMNAYHRTAREKALKKFRQLQLEEDKKSEKLSQADKDAIEKQFFRDSIIDPYKDYLETGVLSFGILPYRIVYEALTDRLKFIDLSREEKIVIYQEAIATVKSRMNKPTQDPEKHKEMVALIRRIQEQNFGVVMKDDLVAVSHEISIRNFFEKAKQDGIDIEGMIETFCKENHV